MQTKGVNQERDLAVENQELRERLDEAQETLRAIQHGEVDALVVTTPQGEQIFTIVGAEKPYRLLIEEMKEGAVLLSDDNAILYCNSGFAKMVKSPIDKIIGSTIQSLIAPTHMAHFEELLSLGRAGKGSMTKEVSLKASNNSLVPTQMSINSLVSDDIKTTFLVVTDLTQHMEEELKRYTKSLEAEITQRKKTEEALKENEQLYRTVFEISEDGYQLFNHYTKSLEWEITQRKKAEQALRKSEQLYRTVFENSEDGYQLFEVLYNKNGKPIDARTLKVNPAFEKQTGLKATQVVGRKVSEYMPNVEPVWLEIHDKVLKTGRPAHVEGYQRATKRFYDVYFFPYSTCVVGSLFRDITKKKKLEKYLRTKERMAAIGETADIIGRTLLNPMQALIGEIYATKAALKLIPDSEQKAYLQESIDALDKRINYMDKIVSDLQVFIKPVEPHMQEVKLKPLIDTLLAQANVPKNILTTLQIPDDITVEADPPMLRRVVNNLITNAIQAMPEEGELTIRAQTNAKRRTQIVVEDTGVGIPEKIKPKIFTLLFITKEKGRGFGLAACKHIIEAQGGTIKFESIAGRGTKFILRLPTRKIKQ